MNTPPFDESHLDELRDLMDTDAPKARVCYADLFKPKPQFVEPDWWRPEYYDHPAWRVASKAELIYHASTGRFPTAKTRALMVNDSWFRDHVERTGQLPHARTRARRARATVQRVATEPTRSVTLPVS